jgi:hypothetical protein
LYQFIVRRGILNNNKKKTLSIFSVNGNRMAIDFNRSDFKIFYTVENVHVLDSYWQKYEDLLLDKKSIDLSLGYDYIDHEKYLRFPYWIMTNFKPEDDYAAIKRTCDYLNKPVINMAARVRFCSFVCRYDYFGNRRIIYDQISQVDHIDCDSLFMHNNNLLKDKFNNQKREYLKEYKFNLCPENSNTKGYVTEKIFDAIYSGCIPVYWGSENHPEPEILNQNAIFFFDHNSDNSSLFNELKTLNENPRLYKEFATQNRLQKNSQDIIYEYFTKLDRKLRKIVNSV